MPVSEELKSSMPVTAEITGDIHSNKEVGVVHEVLGEIRHCTPYLFLLSKVTKQGNTHFKARERLMIVPKESKG